MLRGRGVNMHSKKYIIEKIEEFGRHNSLYDDVEGDTCYLAYLKAGERLVLAS
jgi:hypothetical protein